MVLSKLDSRIKYDESRLVYDEDIGMDASLYEIFPDALEYKVNVAIGKIKYTYVRTYLQFLLPQPVLFLPFVIQLYVVLHQV